MRLEGHIQGIEPAHELLLASPGVLPFGEHQALLMPNDLAPISAI